MKKKLNYRKINYIYSNSLLSMEYLKSIDEYELNIIYKKCKSWSNLWNNIINNLKGWI